MKRVSIFLIIVFLAGLISCTTTETKTVKSIKNQVEEENAKFLAEIPANNEEIFRVLIMSDRYEIVKAGNVTTIERTEDKNGDKYISDELARFDKINESREAVLSIALYPDSGRIMKVRPKRLAALREIDELIVEDIQRWSLVSPQKKQIAPLKFDVRYRVVLRKKQSDEEIIKEVREKMKEKASQ